MPQPPQRAPAGTPLYVHLPFCVHKCPYCDFFSIEGAGQDRGALIETLLQEASLRAPESPRSVFFGGGTPSYLSETELRHLLDGLEARTGFRASATEVTAECNPESLDSSKSLSMRDLGINRLSVGVQSLDPDTLRFFERPHSPDQALEALELARDGGFESFSADLIHGAPGESLESFAKTLRQVLELEPPHVSAYGLTYEPGTPLQARLERGEFEPQDEQQELDNLELAAETLTASGRGAYEVSNYSLNGHKCSHNVNYWLNGPYVGLGPSAASHVAGTRSGNARSLARWTRAVAEQAGAPAWSEHLDPRARLGETWWLGLRLASGVDPEAARATARWQQQEDPALETAKGLVDEGLLGVVQGHYRLTDRGRPLADHVGRQFLGEPVSDREADESLAPRG